MNTENTQPLPPQPPVKRRNIGLLIAVAIVLALIVGGLATYAIIKYTSKTKRIDAPELIEEGSGEEVRSSVLLRPTMVRCINVLAPQGSNTYEARNLFDENPATSWSCSPTEILSAGDIEGPVILFADKVKLTELRLRNGYCKSDKSYRNNSRPASIVILGRDSDTGREVTLYSGPLKDTPSYQSLNLKSAAADNWIDEIHLVLPPYTPDGYYQGECYPDICLSEMELRGYRK